MTTELRGCDSIFDLSCPCKKFKENIFAILKLRCICGHGINDHTYEVRPESEGVGT